MATEVLLPQWGMEMAEGTIVKWLKNEGDHIQEGEPLVAIETAKLETDLESVATGVITRIMVPEGATVPIRTVLAVIAEPGEVVDSPSPAPAPSAAASSSVTQRQILYGTHSTDGARVQVVPAARRLARDNDIDLAAVRGSGPGGRILIADVEQIIDAARQSATRATDSARVQVVPAARRLARDNGIDLESVQGSGPGGRILIADVERAIAVPSGPEAQHEPDAVPLTGMRRTIASRMMQSLQTMAQVTLTTEADITDAMTLRDGIAGHTGGLSPLAMVIKATAQALKDHPRLNAVQGEDSYHVMPNIDIGVAVSLEEGLITPVLRGADGKGLAQISAESRDLATMVRENRARPEDVTGGTFTITNLGANDVDGFTPIINPPHVAILGVGRVVEKPVIHDGEIVKGRTVYLSLTFDHRIVDGAPAAEFLRSVRRYLEDPWWMVA